MQEAIREFVKSKRIGVVGVSHDGKKFGSIIYTELKKRGYKVFGVNPTMPEVDGDKCYPNLSSIRGEVEAAVVCIKPELVEPVLREAHRIGLNNIWLQQGSQTIENTTVGKLLGLNVVAGKCILMYMEPVGSVHKVHRFFVKLFGKY